MKRVFYAGLSGLVFGIGLAVSQMVDPNKVQGFLDIAGNWDPSLALVMTGALLVTVIGFNLILRRSAPVAAYEFHVPTRRNLDRSLLLGAALFGIGWGMTGFCPGPAIAALGLSLKALLTADQTGLNTSTFVAVKDVILMVIAIYAGMLIYNFTNK